MNYKKVIYIGVIDDKQKKIVGGFATANARNIDEYLHRKFTVVPIGYPILKNKGIGSMLLYFLAWLNFFVKCFFVFKGNKKTKNETIVHITPLYKYFIYMEFFVIRLCKFYNQNILIDLRAGSFIRYYEKRGLVYRRVILEFLKLAKYITVEGEKYISFINNSLNIDLPILYYPNYVKNDEILTNPRKLFTSETIELIYFGRINEQKGIKVILNTHNLLKVNYTVKTTIIGKIDKDFNIDETFNDKDIMFLDPLPKMEINKFLNKAHFFIFPTKHQGEGHSNALAEAMAYGVVPIVSDNGFNKDVVANAGRVLNINALEQDYFEEINIIIENQCWNKISEEARLRSLNLYSNEIVSNKFFKYIRK